MNDQIERVAVVIKNKAETTVVRHGPGMHAVLWIAFPALGAGIGWVLSRLPRWISSISYFAEWKSVEFLVSISGLVFTLVLIGIGFAVGCLLALTAYDDIVTVEVNSDAVSISSSGNKQTYRRGDIHQVFMDNKELVILGANTAELARIKNGHKTATLKDAFSRHGHPWLDEDPYADQFQRWVDGIPGIDERGQALLRARQLALESDDKDDAIELRQELSQHGIVVRDVNGKQYWRPAGS